MQDVKAASPRRDRMSFAQCCRDAECNRPLHCRFDQSSVTQIALHVPPRRRRGRRCKETAKDAKFERIPHLQRVQRREQQRRTRCGEISLGPRCVRVHDVAGDEKAAVGAVAHSPQYASSSRSNRTKLGSARLPKMRLARASTSGHLTRFTLAGRADASSSRLRIASINFLRSRAGRALTCLRSSTALMPSNLSGSCRAGKTSSHTTATLPPRRCLIGCDLR